MADSANPSKPDGAPGGGGKKEKKKPEGLVIPPKKPKLTKAERRALQEQQRAAKAAAKDGGGDKPKPSGADGNKKQQQQQKPHQAQQQQQQQQQSTKDSQNGPSASAGLENASNVQNAKTISLFSHLRPYQDPKSVVVVGPSLLPSSSVSQSTELHPAVMELGSQYALGKIRGGNSRCRAMLRVFHQVIEDFVPQGGDVRHELDVQVLKPSFTYWTQSCRPHSVSMGNAFTFLKAAVSSLDRDISRDEMVSMLQDTIEAYIRERIDYAGKAIAQQPALTNTTTASGEPPVFLTYGHSEAIAAVFIEMALEKRKFRVIIVDSRPLLEGKTLLRKLGSHNIDCTYILLNALTYVMKDVTKVYLGASALMSDGSILGRVGTASIALSAQANHIPVLVCCESYKISTRVQLESITGNELGNPDMVATISSPSDQQDSQLKDWLNTDNLRLLNLLYDLTPSTFVSGIVTELGIIPPTSVAVLLREMAVPQEEA